MNRCFRRLTGWLLVSWRYYPGDMISAGAWLKADPCDRDLLFVYGNNGAVDNTFVQFYPTLIPVAKEKGTFMKAKGEMRKMWRFVNRMITIFAAAILMAALFAWARHKQEAMTFRGEIARRERGRQFA